VATTIRARVAAITDAMACSAENLHAVSKRIDGRVEQMMTSLQFQDITRQEIEHVITPLDELAQHAHACMAACDSPVSSTMLPQVRAHHTVEDEQIVMSAIEHGRTGTAETAVYARLRGAAARAHQDTGLGENITLF
jgi:hypothetical protein